MRQIAFVKNHEKIQKLMIYECSEGVYLFGYDRLNDTSCIWDLYYNSLEESKEYCNETYSIDDKDWIEITDPEDDCQHDFILPTKKSDSNSQYKYQFFVGGQWRDNFISDTTEHSFGGLTANERLFITGLIYEYDKAKINDHVKAEKILIALSIKA